MKNKTEITNKKSAGFCKGAAKGLMSVAAAAIFCSTVFAGCGSYDNSSSKPTTPNHTLYFRTEMQADKVTVNFFNTVNGDKEDVEMKNVGSSDGYVFSCMGDTTKYNKVTFTYDDSQTKDVAFNEFVNGWNNSSYGLVPFTEGEKLIDKAEFTTETLKYKGNDKEIYIWTPENYDAKSAEKYSTIYLYDGQWMLVRDFESGMGSGCWNVAENVTSMMKESNNKAIVVAISTTEVTRCDELIPDLGDLADPDNAVVSTNKEGKIFCNFVVNELVPFIQKKYNVYADAAHTSIAGSSLGGMAAFYAGMEHPDVFGTVGALSPAFAFFDESVWDKYLKDKDFEKSPCVYMYSGDVQDNKLSAEAMKSGLLDKGFPKDKLFYHYNPNGEHIVPYWRNIFSEYLVAMFDREALLVKV